MYISREFSFLNMKCHNKYTKTFHISVFVQDNNMQQK